MPTEPLGYPVAELIVRNVQDVLKGVTFANGYGINVTGASRPENKAKPMKTAGFDVEARETGIDFHEDADAGRSHGHDVCDLNLELVGTFNKGDSDLTPSRTMMWLAIAAVRDALYADVQRGGNAIMTYIPSARPRTDSTYGFVIDVRIHFHTPIGNAFTSTG